MSVAATVCALFLLYPALVQSAASLLDCIDVDTVGGMVSVVRTDTSLRCEGERYDRARVAAWCVLTFVGVLGPVLSAAALLMLSRWTCEGSVSAARMIMFFMTGGYRPGAWYWECIVLVRKLLLVICVTMLSGGMSGILGCIWTLGAVAALTMLSHPFDRASLQFADLLSQCSTAAIFGLGGVTLLIGPELYGMSLGVLVGVVHLIVLALFACLIVRLLWLAARDALYDAGILSGSRGVQRLDEQAALHLNDIRDSYPRFFTLLVVSHSAEQLLMELEGQVAAAPSPRNTTTEDHLSAVHNAKHTDSDYLISSSSSDHHNNKRCEVNKNCTTMRYVRRMVKKETEMKQLMIVPQMRTICFWITHNPSSNSSTTACLCFRRSHQSSGAV